MRDSAFDRSIAEITYDVTLNNKKNSGQVYNLLAKLIVGVLQGKL